MKKSSRILLIFFCLLLYLLLTPFLQQTFLSKNSSVKKINKIEELYDILLKNYHSSITEDTLFHSLMDGLLMNLDPFTIYISKEQLIRDQEDMSGDFYGIGIQFSILRDTVMIIKVIDNGPSKTANLLPGDRIIFVDGEDFTGEEIGNKKVMNTLRGERGKKVELTIFRKDKGKIKKTLYRDAIPLNSIEASYVIKDDIGYLKLRKFSATTHNEFLAAMSNLKLKGTKKLILDLRDNGGGYLQQAIDVANEFLEKGHEIVSTDGEFRKKRTYFSNRKGLFKKGELVVLINESSASASEILAGAIQDNDRGYIVGNRSFGKGLVQEQFPLKDGSVFRVTVAKYYTPSGRCIQKPYHINDSIVSSEKFTTKEGREVYSQGGIMPDHIINRDTISKFESDFWIENQITLYEKAFDVVDNNRTKFNDKNYKYFLKANKEKLWMKIKNLNNDRFKNDSMMLFKKDLITMFERMIINHILSNEEIIYFDNKDDDYLKKALEILLI